MIACYCGAAASIVVDVDPAVNPTAWQLVDGTPVRPACLPHARFLVGPSRPLDPTELVERVALFGEGGWTS